MEEWVDELINEWMNKWMNEWTNESMNESMNIAMNAKMKKQIDKRVSQRMNESRNGFIKWITDRIDHLRNKAGYTANTSCGRVGRGENAVFPLFDSCPRTDWRTDGPTDGQSVRN